MSPYEHIQRTLIFDPVYLHVSSSAHSCEQTATSVVTDKSDCGPNRKWHQIRCSVISPGWVGENDRVKGRKKRLIGGKRKLPVFHSHSVAAAQTSQTLWSCKRPARQIKWSNLIAYLLKQRSYKHAVIISCLIPSDGITTYKVSIFGKFIIINIFGLDFADINICPVSSCICLLFLFNCQFFYSLGVWIITRIIFFHFYVTLKRLRNKSEGICVCLWCYIISPAL